VLVACGVLGAAWLSSERATSVERASAPEVLATSAAAAVGVVAGVDADSRLEDVAAHLLGCAQGAAEASSCAGIVYVWSPRMPLSRTGIAEIAAAAEALGVTLHVVQSTELTDRPSGRGPAPPDALARALISTGATLHEPALVVHAGGRLLGPAILGFKTADAYRSLVEERLASATPAAAAPSAAPTGGGPAAFAAEPLATVAVSWTDLPARGQPGAYFRWVPERNAVAYESGGAIYLLDLESGESSAAPGFVDFVPTPDGRYFVTPGRNRALEFYDADEVFEAAAAGRGRQVPPFFVDAQMQDQYPSVGILSTAGAAGSSRTVYRVLTSWYDRVAFRDYEVRPSAGGAPASVRSLGPPVEACAGFRFSIPILSQTGLEVAGRDEATGTTKVLRIGEEGRCSEAADIGLPTGKVAWSPDGKRLAFAIPAGAVSDGSGVLWRGADDPARAGVFVYDRESRSVSRVEASQQARRLTFPEFVGPDRLVFLLPGERQGAPNRFRLVCCFQ
jgi:hypothetical protein